MSLTCKVLTIDAWREPEGGWTWNQWYDTGRTFELEENETNRSILKKMREDLELLSEASKGKVAVEDDGYNMVIAIRGTMEPMLAIEYGVHY